MLQDKEIMQKMKVALFPTELAAEEMKNLKQTLQVMSDNLKTKGDCTDMLEKRAQSQLTHQQ